MNAENSELHELFAAHLDGSLSDNERKRLNGLLQADAAARAQFARLLRQETLLGEVLRESAPVREHAPSIAPATPRLRLWPLLAAAAASVLFVVGAVAWNRTDDPQPRAFLVLERGNAQVNRDSQAQTVSGRISLAPGDQISAAENAVGALEFSDRSRLAFQGATTLKFGAGKVGLLVTLNSGNLHCDVQPQAADAPLTIVTPEMNVTVVGTKFLVSATDGESSVHVSEGRVRVGARSASDSAVEVGAGQFTSLRAGETALIVQAVPKLRPVPDGTVPARKQILMVVADPIPAHAHDVALKALLEDWDFDVTERVYDTVTAADLTGKDLIILPSHRCQNARLFSQTPIPVIAWHNVWHVDLGMSEATQPGQAPRRRAMRIVQPAHLMVTGLQGSAPTFELFAYSWHRPGAQAEIVLELTDSKAGTVVYAYEKGAVMHGFVAPARRVGFSLDVREATTPGAPSDAGARVLKAAIAWCLEGGGN